jgi:MYXO-CTERM domain-containing protein
MLHILAAIVATDSFVCAASNLNNHGGGTGWAGNWVTGQPGVFLLEGPGHDDPILPIGQVGGVLHYDGSATTYNTGARIFRQIDVSPGSAADQAGLVESAANSFSGLSPKPAIGKPGTSVWFGVVMNADKAGNSKGDDHFLDQVHLYNWADTSSTAMMQGDQNKQGEAMAIGRAANNYQWNFERTCAHDPCPGGATSSSDYVSTLAVNNQPHWLVMRFDFVSSATTNVTMWIDPTPGASAPADTVALPLNGNTTSAVAGLHFNWIELGGQTSNFYFDEVRLATTFADLSVGAANVDCGGAPVPDAGPFPDANPLLPDARLPPGSDGGSGPGGPVDNGSGAGCSCAVGRTAASNSPFALILAVGFLLVLRRIAR